VCISKTRSCFFRNLTKLDCWQITINELNSQFRMKGGASPLHPYRLWVRHLVNVIKQKSFRLLYFLKYTNVSQLSSSSSFIKLTSVAGTVAKYCKEHVSVCVCLSVCPRGYLRYHTHDSLPNFCACCLYGRVSVLLRRCCDTLYVLSVFWMTCSSLQWAYRVMNFAANDRFRLNLHIYRKVGQN